MNPVSMTWQGFFGRIALSFVSASALAFLFFITTALRDDRITTKETRAASLLFAAAFIAFFILSLRSVFSRGMIGAALALSAAIGVLIYAFIPNGFTLPERLFWVGQYHLEVLDLEPDTVIELFWAYRSDGLPKGADGLESPRALSDLSYADFKKSDGWNLNESGVLVTGQKGATLDYAKLGLHTTIPVLAFRSVGSGDAFLRLEANGEKIFASIDHTFADSTAMFPTFEPTLRLYLTRAVEVSALLLAQFPVFAALVSAIERKRNLI